MSPTPTPRPGADHVEAAIRSRRTIKLFDRTPLGRDELDDLLQLAAWAPNHHLTNPYRFRVLGPDTLEQLKALAEADKPGGAMKLSRAPTLVLLSAHLAADDPADREEDLLATATAAYVVLLAAHVRGYVGYWRSPGVTNSPAARDLLGLDPADHPVALLHLGHPLPGRDTAERTFVAPSVTFLD